MLAIGSEGLLNSPIKFNNKAEIEENIRIASPRRLFAIGQAFYQDFFSVDEVWTMSKIDKWFLAQLKRITNHAKLLKNSPNLNDPNFDSNLVLNAKKLGFSDNEIAKLTNSTFKKVRDFRTQNNITLKTKQIDTLAAEFPAQTNYLYTTFHGKTDDV